MLGCRVHTPLGAAVGRDKTGLDACAVRSVADRWHCRVQVGCQMATPQLSLLMLPPQPSLPPTLLRPSGLVSYSPSICSPPNSYRNLVTSGHRPFQLPTSFLATGTSLPGSFRTQPPAISAPYPTNSTSPLPQYTVSQTWQSSTCSDTVHMAVPDPSRVCNLI